VTWLYWVLTVAGFVFLIVIHEFGHFIAAKATGMRVERFFLFFPPKVVSIKRGETEYGIGAIPLAPPEGEKSGSKGGLGAAIEGAGQRRPREPLPPDVLKRAYYKQPVWKRIVVISAGPAMNLLLAFAILFVVSLSLDRIDQRVGTIDPGTPAATQLQSGDRILAVDGKSFPNDSREERLVQFSRLVAQHEGAAKDPKDGCRATTPVQMRIDRDGRVETISMTPVYDAELERTRLGFTYGTESAGLSPPGAAGHAAGEMWRVTTGTLTVFSRIFQEEERKKIHGIVGISDVTQQAFSYGVTEALTLIAFISLSLAIINLFPFLPLDGGHIFWSLVEKVRGSPVPFSVMERSSAVGFVLVMILFAIGLTNDINSLQNGGLELR
jgi:regulator of sigma E protease